MARQIGTGKIQGTLGDITFYKSRDGLMAKLKSAVSADRIATDPAYARTRENGLEFGRAAKAGKVIRSAFSSVLSQIADSRVTSRLQQAVKFAQNEDTVSERGKRNIITGNASLLEHFEFNDKSPFSATFVAQFLADVDRATGIVTVDTEAFIPARSINAPDGATHFKLFSAAAEINFESGSVLKTSITSPEIELGLELQPAINLVQQLSLNSMDHIIIVLGIEFYQQFNGRFYPLNNGSANAVTIARVDMP
jgi:hypothetical protein